MFNMKTSDLFKRAKQLADLEGSDFISWNEAINCINESYVGLYEKLVNMGDNTYVGSFHTVPGVTDLPSDFWQLKGVYLYNNGNLQPINRRADNNGFHHISYEIRNGKLEVFGSPNDVLVEYYQKPEKLFFKPSSVLISLPEDKTFLDCCGHLFLYSDVDEQSNPILSIYDVDEFRSAEGVLTPGTNNYITKDYVIAQTGTTLSIYDMATGYSATLTNSTPIVDENGDLFILNGGNICDVAINNDTYILTTIRAWSDAPECDFIAMATEEDFYTITSNVLGHNGTSLNINAKNIIYDAENEKCYFLGNQFGYVTKDNTVVYVDKSAGQIIGFVGINENTGYGYATKKYNSYYVEPYCEDTALNFPNSFYYQIISYMLAIAFRSKQGADISLLANQLATIEQTFEETLGSDAYQFPRMGNVY